MKHIKTLSKRHPQQATIGIIWQWFQNLCLCVNCDALPLAVQLMFPWFCPGSWSDLRDEWKG